MEIPHFIFWELLKAVALICLALLGAKIILTINQGHRGKSGSIAARIALLAVLIGITALGARTLGYDAGAEIYYWSASKDLQNRRILLAYSNAVRAVRLRPAELRYWQTLERIKFEGHQFASAIKDEPALKEISGGHLASDDATRFAACRYFLGEYPQAISITEKLIRLHRFYPPPYLIQAMSYIALKQYGPAEKTLVAMLDRFPSNAGGVAELARAYYLEGSAPKALAVLDITRKYPFPPEARQRFRELKALYAQ